MSDQDVLGSVPGEGGEAEEAQGRLRRALDVLRNDEVAREALAVTDDGNGRPIRLKSKGGRPKLPDTLPPRPWADMLPVVEHRSEFQEDQAVQIQFYPEWLTGEIVQALEPLTARQRITVLLLAEARACSVSERQLLKKDKRTPTWTTWYGSTRKGVWTPGWRHKPEIQTALRLCEAAISQLHVRELALEIQAGQVRLAREVHPSVDALVGLRDDGDVSSEVRRRAANDILDWGPLARGEPGTIIQNQTNILQQNVAHLEKLDDTQLDRLLANLATASDTDVVEGEMKVLDPDEPESEGTES